VVVRRHSGVGRAARRYHPPEPAGQVGAVAVAGAPAEWPPAGCAARLHERAHDPSARWSS